MTPEQIKHREFPVRIKGYDPSEVRRFLDQVAAAFRTAAADTDGRVPTDERDLSTILAAAHDAADKVILDANNKVASLVAKAEDKHRQATEDASRAKRILERAQERSAVINADCREAQKTLADAESKAAEIVAAAHERAADVRLTERAKEIDAQFQRDARKRLDAVDAAADRKLGELDKYVAKREEEIDALHEAARVSLEEAQHQAVVLHHEAEERATAMLRLAEREARRRIEVLEEKALEERALAEHDARERVNQILTAAQGRIDALVVREQELSARVAEARAELRSIVERFVGDGATIDLTAGDPVVAFEGTYDEAFARDDGLATDRVADDTNRIDEAVRERLTDGGQDGDDRSDYDEYFDVELPEAPVDEETEAALTEVTLNWNKPAWALAGSGATPSR